jgi:hypothetical protein
MKIRLLAASAIAAALAGMFFWKRTSYRVEAAPPPPQQTAAIPGGRLQHAMVGHEFRQDDLPSIAASPDGSLWVAWLSFVGDRDDVVIRHYAGGKWGALQWVPNTSGDSWLPQVAVDSDNRVWVVWSQQVGSNWDIYARRFDPERQEWSAMERLTNDPLPDINPRLASDGKGRFALAWQGFRGRNSNIFLKTFDGAKWSGEIRVTNRAANDWEPAVAIDSSGAAWVAYDSYKNGNYDVYLTKVTGAQAGQEITVSETPYFEARATVAVDTANRVWVAWEQGNPNWGKDQGYTLRQNPRGVQLGGARSPRIRVYDGSRWQEPSSPLQAAFGQANTYQPHVFSDGKGSVWVAAKKRLAGRAQQGVRQNRGYWEYWLTRADGAGWAQAFAVPESKGRSSTRINATLDRAGALWLAWDTDGRGSDFYHRPIRQKVHAGSVAAPSASGVSLGEVRNEAVNYTPSHPNDAADVQAIRGYTASINGKQHHIVRGDFHRHTELSWDGGGAADGSLQDFYRYMIDAGAMDFGASTDHQGGAWPYWWWYTQKMTDMYHVPGAYAAIFGYERSAIFPNGHRNMFFAKRSESRVTPFFLKEGAAQFSLGQSPMGDEPGIGSGELVANDTKLLYEEIRQRRGVAISHTSGTRMGTDWRDNDPDLEPVVEIFQGARTNYEKLGAPLVVVKGSDDPHMAQAGYQPEGMVANAWAKGYKLGIITSSDHGSTHISYAMVYTGDASRQGILDAIRKRHTYGAMDNIILEVRMGNHFMGDEFAMTKAAPIRVKAQAPANIVKVAIVKDNEVIYTVTPNSRNVQFEYTDKGDVSGRHFYYVRVEEEKNLLAWSSPFFVNYGRK